MHGEDDLDSTELDVTRKEDDADSDTFDASDPPPSPLPRARHTIEGTLGLLAAFFIGLPAPLFAAAGAGVVWVTVFRAEPLLVILLTGAIGFYLASVVVRLAARAVEGDGIAFASFRLPADTTKGPPLDSDDGNTSREIIYVPLALAMAVRLPNWPNAIRPIVAVWWLCHFLAAAMIGHAVAAHWLNGVNNRALIVAIPVTLLVTFAFLFAANLYLMLAVAVSVRHPGIWLIAWRHRFIVDLILAAILLWTG